MYPFVVLGRFCGGEFIGFLIDAPMFGDSFDGVGIVCEQAVDMFEVEQAGAIDELVEHPCGQILRVFFGVGCV
jgi:hypothetical protein